MFFGNTSDTIGMNIGRSLYPYWTAILVQQCTQAWISWLPRCELALAQHSCGLRYTHPGGAGVSCGLSWQGPYSLMGRSPGAVVSTQGQGLAGVGCLQGVLMFRAVVSDMCCSSQTSRTTTRGSGEPANRTSPAAASLLGHQRQATRLSRAFSLSWPEMRQHNAGLRSTRLGLAGASR